jgi:GntR family transcriptional regulator
MNGNGRVNGRLPRYHQIAQALRARIREGTLRPGARLDTQRRLATSFGVTLMTLRQALELLEREHLISRRHGLGTFVAARSIEYDILQLRRFAGDLSAKGEHVTTRLLATRFSTPDRRVADALGLGPGARVLVVARLRLVDDHPMSLQCSFLPALIGDEIVRADLARTPLHQALERTLGIVVGRAHETVSAVRLGRREARELGCPVGAPAFESERVSFDAAGAPVVFDRVFIPGDRFRITRELHYEGAAS